MTTAKQVLASASRNLNDNNTGILDHSCNQVRRQVGKYRVVLIYRRMTDTRLASQGGLRGLADAIHARFQAVVSCPECPTISQGYNLNQGGNPTRDGKSRRLYKCRRSARDTTRKYPHCAGVPVSTYLQRARDTLTREQVGRVVHEVIERTHDWDEKEIIRAWMSQGPGLEVVGGEAPETKRRRTSTQVQVSPSDPISSNPSVIPETPLRSGTPTRMPSPILRKVLASRKRRLSQATATPHRDSPLPSQASVTETRVQATVGDTPQRPITGSSTRSEICNSARSSTLLRI